MEAEREASLNVIDKSQRDIYPARELPPVSKQRTVSNASFIRLVDIGGFLFSELLSPATLSLGNVRIPPSSGSASLLLSVYFWSLELDPSRTSANATSWNATCLLTGYEITNKTRKINRLASLNLDKLRCLLSIPTLD